MFSKGDYVIYGTNGICLIQDITTLTISGVDKKREYYFLKPVYLSTSTIYIPVDTADGVLRKAVSKEEADELIKSIPDIPLIELVDEKTIEYTYKEYMHVGNCTSYIQLIKTIYVRKEKRLLNGNKITAVDSRYFKQAEDCLYGELAVALDMSRDEVRTYISECIEQHAAAEES